MPERATARRGGGEITGAGRAPVVDDHGVAALAPGDPRRPVSARTRQAADPVAVPVSPASRMMRRAAVLPIRVYQRTISPASAPRCKYHPSCSRYAVQAIEAHGILRGGVLAAWRLLRCNPFSHGGYDPVSAQTLFRVPASPPSPSP